MLATFRRQRSSAAVAGPQPAQRATDSPSASSALTAAEPAMAISLWTRTTSLTNWSKPRSSLRRCGNSTCLLLTLDPLSTTTSMFPSPWEKVPSSGSASCNGAATCCAFRATSVSRPWIPSSCASASLNACTPPRTSTSAKFRPKSICSALSRLEPNPASATT